MSGAAVEGWTGAGSGFEGQFVEILGVDGTLEAYDFALGLVGNQVDPNGRRGFACWDDEAEEYIVETTDGLHLRVPEASLQACDRPRSDGGHCDLIWPSISLARTGATFARRVGEVLMERGFCLIEMPPDDEAHGAMRHAVSNRNDFTLPKSEVAEFYLGWDHSSKVAWLKEAESPYGLADQPLVDYYRHVINLSCQLISVSREFLGFQAWDCHAGTLLRVPIRDESEWYSLDSGPLTKEDVAAGRVESYLDFVQRRRLCVMYFLCGQGYVELVPREDPNAQPVRIATSPDTLLVFRHDVMAYSYAAAGGEGAVLQTWLMDEPQQLQLETLEGSTATLESIIGGPELAPDLQVHVLAGMCRFPGRAYRLEGDWITYLAQTDTFTEIPLGRFDMSLYYQDQASDQFNASGKSGTKHCGLLADVELISFDNNFFGWEPDITFLIPPIQRVLLELSYEALGIAGYTRQTLIGAQIYTCIADIGIEWDSFEGFRDNEAWLKALPLGMLTANRLCHTLGITGPCHQIDTACSASLVASNMCHAALRKHRSIKTGMSFGQQQIMTPFPFVGLSAAGMLGRGGRCKTFDQSANGYNRGEGCGGLISRRSDDLQTLQDRIGCYCGSYINQDGRSASLTAPNGPSQQMVIRGSLNQGQVNPDNVVVTENHGTGTALGDPIETGSISAVFRRRGTPLFICTGKTHMGHLECGAGSVGILKTLCHVTNAGVPANCHLRQLNTHCDSAGFPGMFQVELIDIPTEYHFAGCNGFGFGGTNTRADFFGHRRNGVHRLDDPCKIPMSREVVFGQPCINSVMPRLDKLDYVSVTCALCQGPMCWLCGVAVPESRPEAPHRCADLREESASYMHCSRCYKGGYHCRAALEEPTKPLPAEHTMCMLGTWSAWTELDEMKQVPARSGGNIYEGEIVLGETRTEQFHLVVCSKRKAQVICPVVKRAGQKARIIGPQEKADGKTWLIDGIRDGKSEGTVYKVRFEFGDAQLSISWQALETGASPATAAKSKYEHKYFMVNSLSNWVPVIGTYFPEKRLWCWFNGKISKAGRCELLFLRDEDQSQMIYPMRSAPTEESVPIVGPDEGGTGKRWVAWGEEGESLYAMLQLLDGHMSVTLRTQSMGEKTWHGVTASSYYVAGSWSRWSFEEMETEPGSADLWVGHFTIGHTGREEFQIVLNQNWNMRIYPASNGCPPGTVLVCGPDRKGNKKNWEVSGLPGQPMKIFLDLAADDLSNKVVCWPAVDMEAPYLEQ